MLNCNLKIRLRITVDTIPRVFIMKTSGEGESERVKYTVSDAVRCGWIKSYSEEGMEKQL